MITTILRPSRTSNFFKKFKNMNLTQKDMFLKQLLHFLKNALRENKFKYLIRIPIYSHFLYNPL
jgi:hypothetical protein